MSLPSPPSPDTWLAHLLRTARVADIHATQGLFFPVAAAYGALIPLLSLAAMTGVLPGIPALATSLGHAHEMLFGYALAVVTGYVTGPLPRWRLWGMLCLWLLARGLYLGAHETAASGVANALFALLLAVQAAPRFATRARKWRNQALAPLLVALAAMGVVTEVLHHLNTADGQRVAVLEAILMLSLLMLFMGGRIIAPAAAGQIQRQGGELEARVQPRLEAVLILAMTAAVILTPWLPALAAAGLLVASLAAAVRLWRWRLWSCRRRPDLWGLGVGYAWLAAGLLLLAGGVPGGLNPMAGIHAITVGALGTLTLGVMTRTRLQWAKRDPARSKVILLGSLLVSAAAVLRLLATLPGLAAPALLWGAASMWTLAFLATAWRLASLQRPKR